MKRIFNISVYALVLAVSVSCNDYLDVMPDNRTELDTPEKITSILVSAYANATSLCMQEMMSDNVSDYGTTRDVNYSIFEEAYRFDDITDDSFDSPTELWRYTYSAIACANLALEAIENLGTPEELLPAKGEALICRAYAHFCLSMLYCLPYHPEKASQYMGIPYMLAPEKTLNPHYERGTLEDVYRNIAADIEEGLPLISDNVYSVPKYHFNRDAANAFAARFYLYYMKWDKVIECANAVLGSDPSIVLRDWSDASKVEWGRQPFDYIDPAHEFNLLLIPLFSNNGNTFSAWSGSWARFTHTYRISKQETYRAKRPMGGPYDLYGDKSLDRTYNYQPYINDNIQKIYMPKWPSQWQTIDQITGVGYGRSTMVAFTTNETLLCRAEAYIHLKDYDAAVKDMDAWNCMMFKVGQNGIVHLTRERINDVYGNPESEDYIQEYTSKLPTSRKPLHPHGFTVDPGEQENMIQCLLYCRRIETIADGLRWQDVKRYGINVDRFDLINYVDEDTEGYRVAETLDYMDLRRAIQLPQEVISAGLTPNPRNADEPNHPFRQVTE